jgi:hypothetical protein
LTTRPPSADIAGDADSGVTPDHELTTGAPRWVKILGIVVLGLAVLFVGLKIAGIGPEHGPGRHSGGSSTPSGATTGGSHTPPPGMQHN